MASKLTHELKCWPEFFGPILSGDKRFDIRFGDRDFRIGDTLYLREWDPATSSYTGRAMSKRISYIMRGPLFGLKPGWVILSFDCGGRKGGPRVRIKDDMSQHDGSLGEIVHSNCDGTFRVRLWVEGRIAAVNLYPEEVEPC